MKTIVELVGDARGCRGPAPRDPGRGSRPRRWPSCRWLTASATVDRLAPAQGDWRRCSSVRANSIRARRRSRVARPIHSAPARMPCSMPLDRVVDCRRWPHAGVRRRSFWALAQDLDEAAPPWSRSTSRRRPCRRRRRRRSRPPRWGGSRCRRSAAVAYSSELSRALLARVGDVGVTRRLATVSADLDRAGSSMTRYLGGYRVAWPIGSAPETYVDPGVAARPPGALGAVATRIGAVRGDVVGIEIIERVPAAPSTSSPSSCPTTTSSSCWCARSARSTASTSRTSVPLGAAGTRTPRSRRSGVAARRGDGGIRGGPGRRHGRRVRSTLLRRRLGGAGRPGDLARGRQRRRRGAHGAWVAGFVRGTTASGGAPSSRSSPWPRCRTTGGCWWSREDGPAPARPRASRARRPRRPGVSRAGRPSDPVGPNRSGS